jgi:hypothetical protein
MIKTNAGGRGTQRPRTTSPKRPKPAAGGRGKSRVKKPAK